MAVHAVNVPVTVGGMDVCPGEIVHMDENGAVKFPAGRLDAVLSNVKALQEEEAGFMRRLKKASSAAEVRAVYAGDAYAKK